MKDEHTLTPFDKLAFAEYSWSNSLNGNYGPGTSYNGYGSRKPYPSVEELSQFSGVSLDLLKPMYNEVTKGIIPPSLYFRQLNMKVKTLMKDKGIKLSVKDNPLSTKLTKHYFDAIRAGNWDLFKCKTFTKAQLHCIAHLEDVLL